jgi:hemoglobin-like flavoprotein
MTSRQKDLVKASWAKVVPIADKAATLFYARLFELDPSLRPMFKSDITEQGRKLMQMITVAVSGLDDLDALLPAVEALGRRHVGYGVKDDQYTTVASALLWTLEKGLGEAWNAELREAWVVVYNLLADTMKKAAT